MYKRSPIIALSAVMALCLVSGAGARAQDTAPTYVPSETTVAVLPVINASSEKDPNFKAQQALAASEELHKMFADRGFKVLDDKVVADAIAAAKINLDDDEQRNRETVISAGAAAKADLAVFVVIDKVYWKNNQHFFTVEVEGHAKITTWLVDVKQQKGILTERAQEAKRGANEIFTGTQKKSEQIIGACAKAVDLALADPLKPYPIDKKAASSR